MGGLCSSPPKAAEPDGGPAHRDSMIQPSSAAGRGGRPSRRSSAAQLAAHDAIIDKAHDDLSAANEELRLSEKKKRMSERALRKAEEKHEEAAVLADSRTSRLSRKFGVTKHDQRRDEAATAVSEAHAAAAAAAANHGAANERMRRASDALEGVSVMSLDDVGPQPDIEDVAAAQKREKGRMSPAMRLFPAPEGRSPSSRLRASITAMTAFAQSSPSRSSFSHSPARRSAGAGAEGAAAAAAEPGRRASAPTAQEQPRTPTEPAAQTGSPWSKKNKELRRSLTPPRIPEEGSDDAPESDDGAAAAVADVDVDLRGSVTEFRTSNEIEGLDMV